MSKLSEILPEYVAFLEGLQAKRAPLIGRYYNEASVLHSPYGHYRGGKEIRTAFDRVLGLGDERKLKIVYSAISEDGYTALLRWDFRVTQSGKKTILSGASEVTFDDQGMIASHVDYWDPTQAIYSNFSLLKGFLNSVRMKLGFHDRL